jgi:carbon-monoxide dehydrogenase small subunit
MKRNNDIGGKRKGTSKGAAATGNTGEKHISLTVNGKLHKLMVGKDVNPDHTLAYTLRETLGYTGIKIACDHGSCGACTVLMDGEAVLSCTMLTL